MKTKISRRIAFSIVTFILISMILFYNYVGVNDITMASPMVSPMPSNTKKANKMLLEGERDFIKGHATYYVPDSMLFMKSSKVSLSIGDLASQDFLVHRTLILSGASDKEKVKIAKAITIGRGVKAKILHSPKEFSVIPKHNPNQIQFVDLYNNESVDWVWDVTPKEIGNFKLELVLEVLLKNDLGKNYSFIPVFNGKVKVFIDPKTKSVTAFENASNVESYDSPSLGIKEKFTSKGLDKNLENANSIIMPFAQVEEPNNTSLYIFIFSILVLAAIGILFFFKGRKKEKEKLASNFTKTDIEKLSHLVASNETAKALELILLKLPKGELKKSATLYLSNHKQNEKQRMENVISHDQYGLTSSRNSKAVIYLIDDLKSKMN